MGRTMRLAGMLCAACVLTSCLGALDPRSSWAQDGAAASDAATIPVSKTFKLAGAVQTPKTYALQDLRAEPVTHEVVYFNTGAGPVSTTFKGVLLWTLLEEVGIKTDPVIKNDILRRTIVVTGTDGYQAVLSAGEINPAFGGELALIAYAQDGKLLGSMGGFARLIVPGDKAGGRNVSSIARIEVR